MSPRVSILIVNWNGRQHLERCLDSVQMQTYPDIEVVLIDNGSTDDSVSFVHTCYPSVVVVESEQNLGFAEGNNEAARHATGDYLFLLNNDAWLQSDTVERLVRTAQEQSAAAIIGCHVVNVDGSLQDVGERIDAFGSPSGVTPPPGPMPPILDTLFYVTGCALFIAAQIFRDLEGFDGRYFMFSEEMDLAWRARLRGYTVVTDTRAMVTHLGGGSIIGGAPGKEARYRTSTTRIYLRERNTLTTLLKNYSASRLACVLPLYFALNVLEVLFFLVSRRPSVSWQYLRAYGWNLQQLPATLRARHRIQCERRVSDRAIAQHFFPGVHKLHYILRFGIPRIAS